MTAAERPQPGDSAQQRTLAGAGGTGHQHRLAGARRQRDILPQWLAVRQIEVEVVDLDANAAALDRDRLRPQAIGDDLVYPLAKAAQALDDRAVFGDLGVARHDKGQRFLY